MIAFEELLRGKLSTTARVHDWFSSGTLRRFNDLAREFNALNIGMPLTPLGATEYGISAPDPEQLLSQLRIAIQYLPEPPAAPKALDRVGESDSLSARAPAEPAATKRGKPTVFIGSSSEASDVAKVIQLNLQHKANCVPWNQGVFGLSDGTLETLVNEVKKFDYAILVLTPDDVIVKRETTTMSARDNVLFELGLFMGALGRRKTFIVCPRGLTLPSDLAGITPATYDPVVQTNIQAHLGPVCTQLEIAMGLL